MKRLMVLMLVLMLALGCVSIAACGGGGDDETGQATGGGTEVTQGQETPEKTGGTSVSGEFTWSDIPVYPGAGEEETFSMAAAGGQTGDFERIEWRYYSTGDNVSKVADFYKSKMPGNGWSEVMAMEMNEVWYGYWEKNDSKTGAYIGVAEDDGESMIWMWRGQGS